MTILIIKFGLCRKRNIRWLNKSIVSKKDKRLSKSLDLTQEIEKQTVEEISATPVDQIVPNRNIVSSDIAEQETRSAGGQDQKKSARSTKTGQIGHKIGPTGPSCNFGNSPKITTRKKPNFEGLLHKYQKIAEEKKIDRLEGNQRRSDSRGKENFLFLGYLLIFV